MQFFSYVFYYFLFFFFFFQAEDGIRDLTVTGVQTCALPISRSRGERLRRSAGLHAPSRRGHRGTERLRPKSRVGRPNGRGTIASLRSGGDALTAMPSDRALQDDVIRALADAPYRASHAWRRRELADPDRVERYARFLARHFYYERIVHFFKYSRALARVTGRAPEAGSS